MSFHQRAQIGEDRSFRTGVLEGLKTANLHDAIGLGIPGQKHTRSYSNKGF
jgi:hypothetical protein